MKSCRTWLWGGRMGWLWGGMLFLSGLMGCSYSLSRAAKDARHPRLEQRQKAMNWLVDYIARTTGEQGAYRQRRKAIRALGFTRLKGAVNSLRMVLMHEKDSMLRREAIRSLARLKDPSALREIQGALQDTDLDVRMTAAAALGRLGDRRALRSLLRALHDKKAAVRVAAVRSLTDLDPTLAITHLIKALGDTHPDVFAVARSKLMILKNRAIPYLIQKLSLPNSALRQRIEKLLANMGKPARVPLLKAFVSPKTRRAAWNALARMTQDRTTWSPLASLLDSKDPKAARVYLKDLLRTGTITTLEALLVLWEHIPYQLRPSLREGWGKLASRLPGERPRLLLERAARRSPSLAYRTTAIFALGYMGPPALPALRQFLQDSKRVIRISAIWALGRVGGEGIAAILPLLDLVDEEIRSNTIQVLTRFKDPRAIDPLIKQLNNPAAKIRLSAAKALGFQGDTRAIPALRQLLQDPIKNVILAAIQSLILLGDRQNLNLYILAIKNSPYPPKPELIRTLGRLGNERIFSTLRRLALRYLKDWRNYVRQARRLYRRLRRRHKSTQEKAENKVKMKLRDHPARDPFAICVFVEVTHIFSTKGYPIQRLLRRHRYVHSHRFNPIRQPPSSCPWKLSQNSP